MYDLGILGGGPAGYVAAERAGAKGLKVILFEEKSLGGVCLNEGCIPTKTLLYSAKLFDQAKESEKYGISVESVVADFSAIMNRKEKVVKKLVGGIKAQMKHHGVEVVSQRAEIKERQKDHVVMSAGGSDYQIRNLLLATGSQAFVPPIKGLQQKNILTNREILNLSELPKSLVIIGGGVIGMEFASFFNSLGTEVTVVEMMDEIIPVIDREFREMLRIEYEKRGVKFFLNSKVVELKGKEVIFEKNGKSESVKGDEILVSIGRRAVLDGFGLEKLGVEHDGKGIKIDEQCRTNIPNVFAAGDITGFSQLAHTASREGEVAVNTILGRKDVMRYKAVPSVIYTNPEIASVGITEEQAKEQGIKYKVKSLPMAYAGRFVVENERKEGLCKIIVGEKYEEILGVHMLGSHSSEMIFGVAMAIESELCLKDLEEIIFPHPTVSEIIKETVFTF